MASDNRPPLLDVSDLAVGYGRSLALRNVSFTVGHGEVVVLLGANGVGKTTTLRAISGLLRPWSGTIVFDGEPIQAARPSRIVARGISQVAEGKQIFPLLTVEENLLLGAFSRRDRGQAAGELEEVYARWPMLGHRPKALAANLSGGQQQMLAIAQALMARPRLLLMDEPSLGLAPTLVSQVFDIVRELRESAITILLVEQMVRKALDVADRGYVLSRGEVVLSGTAAELRDNPDVVRAYLGAPKDNKATRSDPAEDRSTGTTARPLVPRVADFVTPTSTKEGRTL